MDLRRWLLGLVGMPMFSVGSCVQEMTIRYCDSTNWYGRSCDVPFVIW